MALLQSLPQLLWKLCHVFQAHQHLQIKPLQIKSVQEIPNAGSSALKRKLRGDFDSDEESLGYNLESDEEEETIKSHWKIMALNLIELLQLQESLQLFLRLESQSSDYTVSSSTYLSLLREKWIDWWKKHWSVRTHFKIQCLLQLRARSSIVLLVNGFPTF